MATPEDLVYMRRCIDLAAKAGGNTSPNPMVGAMVVHKGKVIGEGFHLKAGTPHAEVHAINSVADKSLLPESTLYVNLEPCSHHGRTPPCTELIIRSNIGRVVVGTVDTSPQVAGRGIARLKEAGIDVLTGVAEDECRHLNRRFFTWHERRRPYVILKWARSADGFIDLERRAGDPAEIHWITGMPERILVHRWRAAEDAILTGGATVRADNPALNVRYWRGKDPKKVIVSRSGSIDAGSKVFEGPAETLLFTRNRDLALPAVTIIQLNDDQGLVENILSVLHQRGIQSLLVEGGAFMIKAFIMSGLWDEARRFTGLASFGGGVPDPFPEMRPENTFRFAGSILDIAFNIA